MSPRLGISAGPDNRKILTVPGAWPAAGRSDGRSGAVEDLVSHLKLPVLAAELGAASPEMVYEMATSRPVSI
jgi:hypothetical protein